MSVVREMSWADSHVEKTGQSVRIERDVTTQWRLAIAYSEHALEWYQIIGGIGEADI